MDEVETGKIQVHKAAVSKALSDSETVPGFTKQHRLGNIYLVDSKVYIHPVYVDSGSRELAEDIVEEIESDELIELHREIVSNRKHLRDELGDQRSEYIEGMIDAYEEVEKKVFQLVRNDD